MYLFLVSWEFYRLLPVPVVVVIAVGLVASGTILLPLSSRISTTGLNICGIIKITDADGSMLELFEVSLPFLLQSPVTINQLHCIVSPFHHAYHSAPPAP